MSFGVEYVPTTLAMHKVRLIEEEIEIFAGLGQEETLHTVVETLQFDIGHTGVTTDSANREKKEGNENIKARSKQNKIKKIKQQKEKKQN
jgi:hypothetical protein